MAKTIWLGLGLWGLTMWPVPTYILEKILVIMGAIGWLGLCVMGAAVIWWKLGEWMRDD